MDLLQDHLTRARASGGVFARTVAVPPWGLRLAGSIQLSLHAVVQGRAWLWFDDPEAAIELAPGELALVRGGVDHHIAHEPAAACLDPEEFRARHAHDTHLDDRRATVFLCGAYRFSGDVGEGLLRALPQALPLSAAVGDPLHDVIAVLSRELAGSEPGRQTVLDRLLDILLVLAIRTSFRTSGSAPRWFRASADPRLGAALQAMHDDATRAWTVPELAAVSGLSRAAFARSFQRALGQAPMQYLTDWRMTLARDYLRTDQSTLAQVAERTGYASPYAFAAAFRRHHGEPPGQWRQQQLERYAGSEDGTGAAGDGVHFV
ncbi:AraC family transcriptional regulator [Streptomyces sp. NBC_01003]|uniref:AraC family transcriptional regulator n=1 Tax=Streptomyces sp. NBC_01003 TaxID=2903714 RepID=UPI00386877B6|nr:AraC family transcriptional regulator [Streptomyces sp. NBC_01003]